MALGDTSAGQLLYIKEGSFGVDPGGNYNELRFTSESLVNSVSSEVSEEIRSDYQRPDIAITGFSYSGDINGELSYGTYDEFMEGLMRGSWGTAATQVSLSDISSASNVLTSAAGSGLDTFSEGDLMYLSHSGGTIDDGTHDGWYVVDASTSSSVTILYPDIADQTAGELGTVVLDHDGILNQGTTLASFSIEKGFTDINQYIMYRGARCGQLTLDVPTQGKLGATFSFMASTEESAAGSSGGGTPVGANTNQILTAPNHLITAAISGITNFRPISFNLTINGNQRDQRDAKTKGPIGIGSGTYDIEISGDFWFEDAVLYNRVLNETLSDMLIGFRDASNNGYAFRFPSMRATQGEVSVSGQNQDLVASMTFQARRETIDGGTTYTMVSIGRNDGSS